MVYPKQNEGHIAIENKHCSHYIDLMGNKSKSLDRRSHIEKLIGGNGPISI